MTNAADSVFVVKSMKGFIARTALMDAAVEMIARKGLNQFSIGDLCDEAGLKRTSFYTYFDSIEDLVEELSNREETAFDERLENTHGELQPGALRLFIGIIGFYQIASQNATWNKFVIELLGSHPQTIERHTDYVAEDVYAAIEKGEFGEMPSYEARALIQMALSTRDGVSSKSFQQYGNEYIKGVCQVLLRASNASPQVRAKVGELLEQA